jgi:hypothetical protein
MLMVLCLKVSGKKIKDQIKENKHGLMVESMKVTGGVKIGSEEAGKHGQMDESTSVIGKTISLTDMVYSAILMELLMMAISLITSSRSK